MFATFVALVSEGPEGAYEDLSATVGGNAWFRNTGRLISTFALSLWKPEVLRRLWRPSRSAVTQAFIVKFASPFQAYP